MVEVRFDGVPYEVVTVKGKDWLKWRQVEESDCRDFPFNYRFLREEDSVIRSVAFLLDIRKVYKLGKDNLHDALVYIVIPEDGTVQASVFAGRAQLRRILES